VMLVARHAALSDIGLHRSTNEDSFVVAPPLFAVADGMGGAKAGEVASALAAETLRELVAGGRPPAEAAAEANARIFRRATEHPESAGMGTTLTAFVLEAESGHFVHVGDSRAYLLRDGHLDQLSDDHSLVGEWLREGAITPAEAAVNRYRSILSRALGTESEVEIDEFEVDLRAGDTILLCSDGLSGAVPDETIASMLAIAAPADAARALVREAKKRGGHDNITVVVVHLEAGDPAVAPVGPEAADENTVVTAAEVGGAAAAVGGAPAAAEPAAGTDGHAPDAVAAVSPAEDVAPARPRRARWRTRLLVGAVALVLVLAGLSVALNQIYYVGVSEGYVAVYRGMPLEIAGVGVHKVYLRTVVPYVSLTSQERGLVDAHNLSSRGAAMQLVGKLGGAP
jgi:PPM family protein phosphatase